MAAKVAVILVILNFQAHPMQCGDSDSVQQQSINWAVGVVDHLRNLLRMTNELSSLVESAQSALECTSTPCEAASPPNCTAHSLSPRHPGGTPANATSQSPSSATYKCSAAASLEDPSPYEHRNKTKANEEQLPTFISRAAGTAGTQTSATEELPLGAGPLLVHKTSVKPSTQGSMTSTTAITEMQHNSTHLPPQKCTSPPAPKSTDSKIFNKVSSNMTESPHSHTNNMKTTTDKVTHSPEGRDATSGRTKRPHVTSVKTTTHRTTTLRNKPTVKIEQCKTKHATPDSTTQKTSTSELTSLPTVAVTNSPPIITDDTSQSTNLPHVHGPYTKTLNENTFIRDHSEENTKKAYTEKSITDVPVSTESTCFAEITRENPHTQGVTLPTTRLSTERAHKLKYEFESSREYNKARHSSKSSETSSAATPSPVNSTTHRTVTTQSSVHDPFCGSKASPFSKPPNSNEYLKQNGSPGVGANIFNPEENLISPPPGNNCAASSSSSERNDRMSPVVGSHEAHKCSSAPLSTSVGSHQSFLRHCFHSTGCIPDGDISHSRPLGFSTEIFQPNYNIINFEPFCYCPRLLNCDPPATKWYTPPFFPGNSFKTSPSPSSCGTLGFHNEQLPSSLEIPELIYGHVSNSYRFYSPPIRFPFPYLEPHPSLVNMFPLHHAQSGRYLHHAMFR
ncbi:uncharacterized protein LOC134541998 [Bacillus rossius redtenbacheri]|uniref:uncharacterized protein LOC134541998 n=1 Tax=Bacillus rossius redtenbacheri TaxID=93214 RepID=UPI002FDE7207